VGWFEKKDVKAERVVYTADFTVDGSFGEPGAVTVLNRHQREFFIESIVVEGFPSGPTHFTCNSWVQPTRVDRNQRVFFTNKPYLPGETPPGLQELRRQELSNLRGEGADTGERRITDRVWEYDVYNDLGNPDKGAEYARPILGGEQQLPYPRRMRTGRPKTFTGKPPSAFNSLSLFSSCHHRHRPHKFRDSNCVRPDMAEGAVAVARIFRIETTRSRATLTDANISSRTALAACRRSRGEQGGVPGAHLRVPGRGI
jgi:hypothetical protein